MEDKEYRPPAADLLFRVPAVAQPIRSQDRGSILFPGHDSFSGHSCGGFMHDPVPWRVHAGIRRADAEALLVSMGTAGFSLMAFEIVVIYLFQAAFGDLYYRLAWVITVFMAGLGIGTWAALVLFKVPERFALAALHAVNAAFFFLLIHAGTRIFSGGFFLGEEYQAVFLGMALLGGLAAGAAFPFANRLFLTKGGGERLGSVYAADLWGSALGALLTAGFFIQIWGVPQTLTLLGAVNALLALLLIFQKK